MKRDWECDDYTRLDPRGGRICFRAATTARNSCRVWVQEGGRKIMADRRGAKVWAQRAERDLGNPTGLHDSSQKAATDFCGSGQEQYTASRGMNTLGWVWATLAVARPNALFPETHYTWDWSMSMHFEKIHTVGHITAIDFITTPTARSNHLTAPFPHKGPLG
jgi:hypothetical protein